MNRVNLVMMKNKNILASYVIFKYYYWTELIYLHFLILLKLFKPGNKVKKLTLKYDASLESQGTQRKMSSKEGKKCKF